MGLDGELKSLTNIMKTKRQNMRKSVAENLVKKRSVGRPRKPKLEKKTFSNMSSETIHIHTSKITDIPVDKVHSHNSLKSMKANSSISEVQVCVNLPILCRVMIFLF